MALNLATKLVPDKQCNLLDDLHINLDDVIEVKLVVNNLFVSSFGQPQPFSKNLDLNRCKQLLATFQEATCRYRYSVKKYPLAIAITTRCNGGGWATTTWTLPFSADKKYLLHPGRAKPVKCYRAEGLYQLAAFTHV